MNDHEKRMLILYLTDMIKDISFEFEKSFYKDYERLKKLVKEIQQNEQPKKVNYGVTLLQKYNGKNVYNNCIDVDFTEKKVSFRPIIDGNKFKYLCWHLGTVFVYYSIFILPAIILVQLFGLITEGLAVTLLTVFLYMSVFKIHILLFFNKKYQHDIYPEYNAFMIKSVNMILKFKKNKIYTVNPEIITNNEVLLPFIFSNVELEYEATGDFSKYLKKIEVLNIFKKNPHDWLVRITFTKKPLVGDLVLKYV